MGASIALYQLILYTYQMSSPVHLIMVNIYSMREEGHLYLVYKTANRRPRFISDTDGKNVLGP